MKTDFELKNKQKILSLAVPPVLPTCYRGTCDKQPTTKYYSPSVSAAKEVQAKLTVGKKGFPGPTQAIEEDYLLCGKLVGIHLSLSTASQNKRLKRMIIIILAFTKTWQI